MDVVLSVIQISLHVIDCETVLVVNRTIIYNFSDSSQLAPYSTATRISACFVQQCIQCLHIHSLLFAESH